MKIAITGYDHPGCTSGPNTWIRRLLPELEQHGIEATALFVTSGGGGPTLNALRQQGISCRQTGWLPYTEQRVRWILQQLADDPPDVFIADTLVAATYATRWVREAGIPVVTIMHSDDAFYRARIELFASDDYRPFRPTTVVCVSQFLEQYVQRHELGKPAEPAVEVRRIPYGVPTAASSAESPHETLQLVYCGRLVEQQKQISRVTTSLCRVTEELSGTQAVMIGDGPDRARVERILAERPNARVQLAGLIDNTQIQSRLSQTHAIVLLSDYEGLPIVLLEAMACGVVPVCLAMRSGVPELVEDGTTGIVVGDCEQGFIDAIARLKQEPELWKELSCAARRRIEADYSLAIVAEQWAELLQSLRADAAPRSPIVPGRLSLPPVHPDLAGDDTRQPGLIGRLLRTISYKLGIRKPFS